MKNAKDCREECLSTSKCHFIEIQKLKVIHCDVCNSLQSNSTDGISSLLQMSDFIMCNTIHSTSALLVNAKWHCLNPGLKKKSSWNIFSVVLCLFRLSECSLDPLSAFVTGKKSLVAFCFCNACHLPKMSLRMHS